MGASTKPHSSSSLATEGNYKYFSYDTYLTPVAAKSDF
jgi:hypothetical protein